LDDLDIGFGNKKKKSWIMEGGGQLAAFFVVWHGKNIDGFE